jgi:hypothetical protein
MVTLRDKPVKAILLKENKRTCTRCVMPEGYPGVILDVEGVCNYCRTFDRQWGQWVNSLDAQIKSETKLRGIFEAAKNKKKRYDALLGISGGKDSSYALHLCREMYGLNVLTFTKDGGFLSDEAKERISTLVKYYRVDHIYYHDPLFPDLARIFLLKTGNFCAPCELSTFNISAIMAREYDIPLLILGTSSRTEAGAPKSLNPWDPWYFEKVTKGEDLQERIACSCYGPNYIMREGLSRLLGHRHIVLLPDFVPWDEDEIRRFFGRKFGFSFGGEHSDCWATGIASYLYGQKLNDIDPNVGKCSLLVRTGKITREEAMERLNTPQEDTNLRHIDRFLKTTGLTHDEFEAASQKKPTPYLGTVTRMFNILRKKIRRQAG